MTMGELKYVELHGDRVAYRDEGSGEALLLIHGMAGSSATWRAVLPRLAKKYRVIAPDLLGHGESAKPRGDYSLGAFAVWLRDLLDELGITHATVVGQSLGGGVAMQFVYQHPDYCQRLVLIAAGVWSGRRCDPSAAVGAGRRVRVADHRAAAGAAGRQQGPVVAVHRRDPFAARRGDVDRVLVLVGPPDAPVVSSHPAFGGRLPGSGRQRAQPVEVAADLPVMAIWGRGTPSSRSITLTPLTTCARTPASRCCPESATSRKSKRRWRWSI